MKVDMISTPDDGSCGIGTYTGDLSSSFNGIATELLPINQDRRTVVHFLALAIFAVTSDRDVIHVQHEYGLFRRTSIGYPSVMGWVFFPVLFALSAVRNVPVVITLHSVLSPDEGSIRRRLYMRAMHRFLAAGADHLVFLSDECMNRFLRDVALSEDEYTRLPHGVNVRDTTSMDETEAKASFGYAPDDQVVMIPGYMRPPKGHDIFADLASRRPEYEFLIAGGARPKGEDHDFAERIASEAPENVQITGILDDDEFDAAFNAADLAVLPYRVVSQSGTFNWCAAHELPALTSEEPYFARLEREWGVVLTADIESIDELARTLDSILESPKTLRALGENMALYKRANSFERVAEHHEDIYRSVYREEYDLQVVDPLSESKDETTRPASSEEPHRAIADANAGTS